MENNFVIFGCITKYQPNDIRPYVESIEKSGFKGSKLMLVYDLPQETIDYLKAFGWDVYGGGDLNHHIILQRFLDGYKLLERYGDDVVIWTDVKDVIFQNDPSVWIEKNMKKDIMAFSECITFKDDEWACVNSGTSFPMEWEWLQNRTSYCAGTIVGKAYALKDLFIEIFRWSLTTANPGQLSDQAAYNVLINLNHFKENVQFVTQEEGFVTQLGTVLIKKDHFGKKLLELTPKITEDYRFTNQSDEEFCLVHQYDRDPNLKQKLTEKYKVEVLPEPKKNDNPIGFSYDRWKEIRKYGKYDVSYNELLKDKKVIVVGPSPSLEGKGLGEYIDSFDLVIRINKAFPVEEGQQKDIGSRTDIHYHCLCTDMHCGGPVFYKEMEEAGVFVSCPYPKYVGPFNGDVKRFERDNKNYGLGFHVLDTDYYIQIAEMLGTRANSGTLTILDLLCYDVKELHITGFTWFRDGWRKSYKDHTEIFGLEEGKRKEEKWLKGEFDGNHRQKPQEDLVREIYLNDDRVSIDDTMKEILEVE
jgi:hypothetical protein